jgi:hypothetical protein
MFKQESHGLTHSRSRYAWHNTDDVSLEKQISAISTVQMKKTPIVT